MLLSAGSDGGKVTNPASGKKQLPPERLLDGVPHRNQAVEMEEKDGGQILWTAVRRRWWTRPPFSWVLPYRERRGVHLDRLGFEIWQACDGTRKVERIVEEFAARHRVSFHEARIAVMQFMQMMARRELIAVVFENAGDKQR